MTGYKAIIVDDEKNIREAIYTLLQQYCPEVKVVGMATSAAEGRELLQEHDVEMIFLDISMPREDGFSFLRSINSSDYAVVFITAHQEYVLNALKANAVDYLLKPVNPFELQDAVKRAAEYVQLRKVNTDIKAIYKESLHNLQEQLHSTDRPLHKITISEQFGFKIISIDELMYLEADQNYTLLNLTGSRKVLATRNIGEFEKILTNPEFYRVHKSSIINLNFLAGYSSYQGNYAEMHDGAKIMISRRKLPEFREYVDRFLKNPGK